MEKTFVVLFLIFLVFSSACIGRQGNVGNTKSYEVPSKPENECRLEKLPGENIELSPIAKFGNITIINATYGYVISKNGTKVFLNVSKAYFFPWGFVFIEKTPEVRTVIFDKVWIEDHVFKKDIKNITTIVEVTRIKACSYRGNVLWEHEVQLPYVWEFSKNDTRESFYMKGIAYPKVLISNNTEYLFIAELPQSIKGLISLPTAKGVNNYLYIYGGEGLVKKFSIPSMFKLRNVFLISAWNYTVFGYEKPQEDWSPDYGEVIIFNGSQVIFRRKFKWAPGCLCNVIHGWAEIYPGGCVYFGLLEGEGLYCNGTFRYIKRENG
ncbi:hypothetical protein [Pyrococcus sp. ST04]|uniref:hypothetical protein n=1 Tax=Pyrococcus sp. ST04 TaxID=1183377 RepID=UPI0002605C86|nr:hypothetical protein [Pyrococcus sp. ST04]AFK22382.1 hypothetical protein Py04_0782 [Pyrococcus sp. ST04]